jgi:hypothetical protein
MSFGGVGWERSQEDDREQANRGRQSNSSSGHNTVSGTNNRVDSPVVSVNNGGGFNHGAGMNGGYARGW